ncbi:MAG: Ni/Fe hydrogenase subunit alpha [Acidobacteriota bacterium]|jgi:coenzyme F420-reducing hydrogenase alpha subunit
MTRTITIDHLARVEGHGGIKVVLDGDQVSTVQLDVFEGIRLLEGLVRGRSLEDVTGIVSRICAICSHGHSITSLQALEDALEVAVTPQTRKLRDLAYHGANIESHALHVFVLALPDLLGHPSVISLAGVNPDAVAMALRLKKLGNTIQEVIGGRAVHPVNYVIGGFGKVPSTDDLLTLKKELSARLTDCERTLEVLRGIKVPDIVCEPIRCAALVPEDEAFFFGNCIELSDGGANKTIPVREYRTLTNEYLVPHSHAKRSANDHRSYMVGALARLTISGDRIGGMARRAWEELRLTLPATNILMNNIAQAVEMIYSVERALHLVADLLETGIAPESPLPYRVRACHGTAATEVPRGILFYSYELDSEGRVAAADVITPTAQNLNHIEDQMRAAVRQGVEAGVSDLMLEQRLAMIARAYDPCISCSVHLFRS